MKESAYQNSLIRRLEKEFPNCLVIKNDASYIQGIPDLLVLYGNKWAMLEVKRSYSDSVQPNQLYYVELLNSMSYASFIYPENEERVFDELQYAFRPSRKARVPKSK